MTRPGHLAVAAMFKNEARYLPEWLAFHLNQGVERFFLHDNGSTDGWQDAVRPFADVVTVYDAPGSRVQLPAMDWTVQNLAGQYRWVAFIDIDEFLLPEETAATVADVLRDYEAYPAIGVHWLCFGTGGHKERPDGLVIENFTQRTPEQFAKNSHIKSIVAPHVRRTFDGNVHITKGGPTVDTEGNPVADPKPFPITHRHLRINHYCTKSLADYAHKIERGNHPHNGHGCTYRYDEDFFQHDRDTVEDRRAARYADAVKNATRKASTLQPTP